MAWGARNAYINHYWRPAPPRARIPAWRTDLRCLLDENKLLCGSCIRVLIRVILQWELVKGLPWLTDVDSSCVKSQTLHFKMQDMESSKESRDPTRVWWRHALQLASKASKLLDLWAGRCSSNFQNCIGIKVLVPQYKICGFGYIAASLFSSKLNSKNTQSSSIIHRRKLNAAWIAAAIYKEKHCNQATARWSPALAAPC